MSQLKTIETLIKSGSNQAHAYFLRHKETLYSELETLKNGTQLLKIFRDLQNSFLSKNQKSFSDYKKAIDFFYKHRHHLSPIDIVNNRENFLLFQGITLVTAEAENDFHRSLIADIQDRLTRQPNEASIRDMLEQIAVARNLLDQSIAKVDGRPQRQYTTLNLQLKAELQKLRRPQASPVSFFETTSPQSISRLADRTVPAAASNSSSDDSHGKSKPLPPTAGATTPPPVRQLAVKCGPVNVWTAPKRKCEAEGPKENIKKERSSDDTTDTSNTLNPKR